MIYSLNWLGSSQNGILFPPAGPSVNVLQTTSTPSQGSYYLGFWSNTAGEGNNGESVDWITVSSIPPDGAMPQATVGNTGGNQQGSPPSAPSDLTATAVSNSQINLSWNAPANTGSSPVTGYLIKQSVSGGQFSFYD